MKLDFFMLADEAEAAEAPGGARKLNIRGGGVTHVTAPAFPYTLPSLAIAVRFFLTDDDAPSTHTFAIRVLDPDGTTTLSIEHEVEIEDLKVAHRDEQPSLFVVGTLGGLLFARPGLYTVELLLDGERVDGQPLAVVQAKSGTGDPARDLRAGG